MADLVTIVGGRPAVLVGHSYGGDVALGAAAAAPEVVRAVGVYEPPCRGPTGGPGDREATSPPRIRPPSPRDFSAGW